MSITNHYPPLTKKEFDSIKTEENSVKVQNILLSSVESRLNYVFNYLCSIIGHKAQWFDFYTKKTSQTSKTPPFTYDVKNNKITMNVDIEPATYKGETINLILKEIPSKFIYEEINDAEINQLIAEEKERIDEVYFQKNKNKIQQKLNRAELVKSIQKKLTKEELSIISFKSEKE